MKSRLHVRDLDNLRAVEEMKGSPLSEDEQLAVLSGDWETIAEVDLRSLAEKIGLI